LWADLRGFLVKLSGPPLLCVGSDFPQTDLTLVPPPA